MRKDMFSKAFHIVCNLCGRKKIMLPADGWRFRFCAKCDQAGQA